MLATVDELKTSDLIERFDVNGGQVRRWHDRGWLRGRWESETRGSGGRLLWEPWVLRVVPVLRGHEIPSGDANLDGGALRSEQLHALAEAMRRDPDAPFYVWSGDPARMMVPAWSAADAVALMGAVDEPARFVVAPPLAEQIA